MAVYFVLKNITKTKKHYFSFRKIGPKRNWSFRSISQHPGYSTGLSTRESSAAKKTTRNRKSLDEVYRSCLTCGLVSMARLFTILILEKCCVCSSVSRTQAPGGPMSKLCNCFLSPRLSNYLDHQINCKHTY